MLLLRVVFLKNDNSLACTFLNKEEISKDKLRGRNYQNENFYRNQISRSLVNFKRAETEKWNLKISEGEHYSLWWLEVRNVLFVPFIVHCTALAPFHDALCCAPNALSSFLCFLFWTYFECYFTLFLSSFWNTWNKFYHMLNRTIDFFTVIPL